MAGEDLTPYRAASKRVLAVLARFGVAERLGLDEVMLDVTKQAAARVACGAVDGRWHAHVHSSEVCL